MNIVIGIIVLVVCAIGAISVVRWVFEQRHKLFSNKSPQTTQTSFTPRYAEDVLESVRDRINNPMPTIVLWSLVAIFCLFKTAEQSLAFIALIICCWYVPALLVFGPASRRGERERDELNAHSRFEYMNSVKKAEEAMKALRDKWSKLAPEERRHQEMLHQIEVTARRNQIETDVAIDSAVASLEHQIRIHHRW